MAIQWGTTVNKCRVGVELFVGAASAGSGTVTVTADVYFASDVAVWDQSNTSSWSGFASGSGSNDVNIASPGSSGSRKIRTVTGSAAVSYGSSGSTSLTYTLSGISYAGANLSVTASATLPARPPYKPYQPSGVTAVRVSDGQINASWTLPTDAAHPVDLVSCDRSSDGGSSWVSVYVGPHLTAISDTSVQRDRRYRYRVAAYNNSAGWTEIAQMASDVYTTPAAPTGVTAVKDGEDIVLTISNASATATSIVVQDSAGGWATVAATVTGLTQARIMAPSSTVVHSYRVATVAAGLQSEWSAASNTVQLLAAPAKPTVSADASSWPADAALVVAWTHNPVDTTAQTAREVSWQTSTDGGVTWSASQTTGKVATGSQSCDFGVLAPQLIRWQVRTWGQYPDPSPWSDPVQRRVAARPVATNNTPATLDRSTLTVPWGYYDAGNSPQAGWRVTLRQGSAAIETLAGFGDPSSVTFASHLADATSYTVDVQVQSAYGLWSAVASKSVAVTYSPPPTPTATLVYAEGRVSVRLSSPAGSPEVIYCLIERDGVLLDAQVPPGGVYVDPIPPLGGEVIYRVQAVSGLPSTAWSEYVSVETPACCLWLNGGPGMSLACAVEWNPQTALKVSPDKVTVQYDGRADEVAYSGVSAGQSLTISGHVHTTAELAALERLVRRPEVACYRDPDGRKIYVHLLDFATTVGYGAARRKAFEISARTVGYDDDVPGTTRYVSDSEMQAWLGVA